jgi:hypothetical protein
MVRTRTPLAILKALATALKTIDEDTAQIFAELTELGLGTAPAADLWRDLMTVDLDFFRSQTSQRIREAGREEGLAEGREKGQVHGIAITLLFMLDKREVHLSEEARQRVLSCTDQRLLGQWLDRVLTVADETELFGEDASNTGRLG